jgi:general secretion pathway protein A
MGRLVGECVSALGLWGRLMYEQYWGLTSAPFDNRVSGYQGFYESPLHEEAMARLLYCVEQEKALAILHGPAGCGKSRLLHVLAGQVRRTQRFFAGLNLGNRCEREFLWQLECQLRLGGTETDSPGTHWRRLGDFFQSTCNAGMQTVLLLDGLERAEDSAVTVLPRLVELHNQRAANLTIIAALNHGDPSRAVKSVLEFADMGMEIKPLERRQTESYVQKRLETSGRAQTVFRADAIDELQQLTGGIPREINRLCDLALLAGMNESLTAIDRDLIEALAGEQSNTRNSVYRGFDHFVFGL